MKPMVNVGHEIGRLRNMTGNQDEEFWQELKELVPQETRRRLNKMLNRCDERRRETGADSQKLKLRIISLLKGDAQRYAVGWYTFQ